MIVQRKAHYKYLMWTVILLAILLFAGGFGNWYFISVIGFLGSLTLLTLNSSWKKIKLPYSFDLYLIFLVLLFVNLFISFDKGETLKFLFLFVSGGGFWVMAYNKSKIIERYLGRILIYLGLSFGIFYLFFALSDLNPPVWGIFSFTSFERTHNHIGDFWALVVLFPIYNFLSGKKNLSNYLLLGLGAIFLAASLSRSAYISLFVGIIFILWRLNFWRKYNKFLFYVLLTLALLFVSASLLKPTIGNRIYFVQAILGIFHFPLGTGVGNFSEVSRLFTYDPIIILRPFSAYVHNIILEILSGMGILGLVFVYWLYKVFQEVLSNTTSVLSGALFIGLFANFFFDRTYVTPLMLWLLFLSLGIASKKTQ